MDLEQTPFARAVKAAGGMTALARKLNERGHRIKGHATIYQWGQTRVPAEYCPDIEALTGVSCEELRPDVNWAVLRQVAAVPKARPDSGKRRRADDLHPKAA